MELSFIVLTWNSERHIKRCLSSIFSALQGNRFLFEIFVVDNGSTDKTSQVIEEFKDRYPDNIIPVLLQRNMGTTYSRNLALKKARGTIIVILDSDIEIPAGLIPRLVNILEEDQCIGLVAPKLVYPDGRFQKSTDRFPTVFSKLFRYFFLRHIERKEARQGCETGLIEVDYAISAMWAFKSELIEKVGLLDEAIFYAPEDVDYCLRIWSAGYKVVYDPESWAAHHAQEISRGWKINRLTIEHIKGLVHYFRKHKYLFRRPQRTIAPFSLHR